MAASVLIVGQGLAGTLLGWAFEENGIEFELADMGHAGAASRVAAGLVNPITGQRIVKSWRVDELLPVARASYENIERTLGTPIWHPVRVHRIFAHAGEREAFEKKFAAGELQPYASGGTAEGFWIESAAWVDLRTLLAASRERWLRGGRLVERHVEPRDYLAEHRCVIDCRGQGSADAGTLANVPWEFSKGEMIEVAADGLTPGTVLNRGHWVLPVGASRARVGATHEPGIRDAAPSVSARESLLASARGLLGRDLKVVGQEGGIRVNLADKRPVAGRDPDEPRLGVCNGLGAKGALWAPWLAQMWAAHLSTGAAFDPAVELRRLSRR